MGIRERIHFLAQFRQEFANTGAIQPSSRFLARAMTAPLRRHAADAHSGRRIVEMGPGTGAVTRAIAAAMAPDDRLDCYELNDRFADYLRRRIASDAEFAPVREQVHVHTGAAQEATADDPVDFVICSVPLNNLDAEQVAALIGTGFDLLGDRGWFTFFEYPLLPRLREGFVGPAERRRIRAVRAIKQDVADRAGSCSRLVLLNLPPARAVHIPAPGRSKPRG